LSLAIGAVVDINIYVSPPPSSGGVGLGRPGFHYHYDLHQQFILQHEGRKLWLVCERKWPLHQPPVEEHVEKALGLTKGLAEGCKNVTLSAGDTLHLPFGSFHRAQSRPGPTPSVHSTIALKTGLISWRRVYELALGDPVLFGQCTEKQTIAIENFVFTHAETAFLEATLNGPLSTVAMRMSINNDDLPADALEHITGDLKNHLARLVPVARDKSVKGCGGKKVAEKLQSLLKPKSSTQLSALTGRILDQLRVDLAGKTPRPPITLTPGPLTLDTRLRRPPTTLLAVTLMDENAVIIVFNEGQPLQPRTFAIANWCLSWNNPDGARGKAFAIRDIKADPKSGIKINNKDRIKAAKYLVSLGVLQTESPAWAGQDVKQEL